jgi:hypothetical protein
VARARRGPRSDAPLCRRRNACTKCPFLKPAQILLSSTMRGTIAFAVCAVTVALNNGLGRTPAMGYSTW